MVARTELEYFPTTFEPFSQSGQIFAIDFYICRVILSHLRLFRNPMFLVWYHTHMTETLSISQGLFPIIVAIFSIIIHEVAHGYSAYILGDETAYRAGRLTLNPLPHIDIIGSVIVPLFAFFTAGTFFGWAKPVPYNVHNVRGKFAEAIVASAGVLTNFLLALTSALVFMGMNYYGVLTNTFAEALFTIIVVNVSLGVFNLTPVPPFDGMSILQGFFPKLHINRAFMYSPLWLIGAILVASVLYQAIAPYIFSFILQVIS